MKQLFTLLFIFLVCGNATHAQTRYIVKFKDKGTNPFSIANPSQYLSPRALARRTRYNNPIDSADLPVTPRYIDSIRLAGAVTILNSSKWLNEVAFRTTDPVALAKINTFPFVISNTAVASFSGNTVPVNKRPDSVSADIPPPEIFSSFVGGVMADLFNYGIAHGQINLHKGKFLHNHGFRGQGMQIAVLDGGFFRYQNLITFDSIRNNNQIIDTRDFVQNNASVNEDDAHGMNCLSTIAANLPGVFIGTAPKADFCLYRTEDVFSETKIEEHNLAAGFERADSTGVDVCTVSLGYNRFDNPSQNYVYANMNGDFTMSAIAADIAAQKGMLPVVAAGNEGGNSWNFIVTPGDADSVMTVGAVDTLGNVAGFSSFGPSADGRVKPNLAATGFRAVIASPNTGLPVYGNGTSFATPTLAGLTTCLWQAFPEFNNMTILDAMQRAASKFTNPDNRVGYGIPDMKKAFVILLRRSYTQQVNLSGCLATFQLNVKQDNSMNVVVERKQSSQIVYTPLQTLAGTGNFSNKMMSFSDDLLSLNSGGTVSYRIRLDIDSDTSIYLDSLIVNVPQTCVNPINQVQLTPNPVTDNANVIVSRINASKITLSLRNAAGQRVYEITYQQPAGGTLIKTINLQSLPRSILPLGVFGWKKHFHAKNIKALISWRKLR
ncbi:MAG: S8 family serine peptidase [Ferruginibacter sp.]